jgi:hypothetical protein
MKRNPKPAYTAMAPQLHYDERVQVEPFLQYVSGLRDRAKSWKEAAILLECRCSSDSGEQVSFVALESVEFAGATILVVERNDVLSGNSS